ncbi:MULTISPECIES: substrate-binding domain-containing protein [unclassified Gilliamella]|uniref:substrate-binding domain-containing protein n=1 Tax=unclassified Gilliamella TaxID=2685620 RepID=UPI00226A6461|nr:MULTISPECIES: substrate-binding domain-containing protein [unclassified Gilliamella]MCX8641380.1 substrate-binding domain-containing protein [Gilliamella sp. B3835]MCX8707490.1 substrate-binding domain-containing protein [Gilliamella sp. B3783]MCX8710570.1 substrate-binding domain-containing protein [Gilliamella sp. B3780]MCX8711256.1 substrate-binding domain-containing protein [Gilliamella sp. B3468]MCX8714685.1 substrate-binding domain-containing protein [Gilliamella sp. B3781]
MASNKLKINDIARLAGVSATTVSHIFNKRDKKYRISPLTRQRVLAIAQQYSDQSHIRQYLVKANSTNTIGVIVPDMSNSFFSMFLHHLEASFRQKNIQLLITCSHYNPEVEIKVAQNLVERCVDAMIVVTSLDSDDFYVSINQKTPVLFFDRYLKDTKLPFITSESVKSVADLIIPYAKQLKEFYFIGCDIQLTSIHARLEGFKQGLKTAGLKFKHDWLVSDDYCQNKGYQLIKGVHQKLGRLPKAIFTPSCNLLQEVLSYLVEIKIDPNQICLCSYDYNIYLDYCYYPTDAIAQDFQTMAHTCVEVIDRLINFKELKHHAFFIEPKIIRHR